MKDPEIVFQETFVNPEPVEMRYQGVSFCMNPLASFLYKLYKYNEEEENFLQEMRPFWEKDYREAWELKQRTIERKQRIQEQVNEQNLAKDRIKSKLKRERKKNSVLRQENAVLSQ